MNQQEMITIGKQVPIGSGPEAREDLMAVLPIGTCFPMVIISC